MTHRFYTLGRRLLDAPAGTEWQLNQEVFSKPTEAFRFVAATVSRLINWVAHADGSFTTTEVHPDYIHVIVPVEPNAVVLPGNPSIN